MRYTFHIAWVGVVLACPHLAAAQDSETLAKLDEALKAASTFEHGGNSGPLNEIEQIVFRLTTDSELREPIEQKLLETLDRATTADGKRFLCKQLRVIGTGKCVPYLEKLLTDPEVSHAARYALGRLEVPETSAALQRALGKTSGKLQAGIIDTLANRGCEQARPDFIRLLGASDVTVAKAAAIGLGRLGGADAVAALTAARRAASKDLQVKIDNSLLNCADRLAADGKTAEAAQVYQAFYVSDRPEQSKFAGLRGLVVTRPQEAAKLLADAVRSDDARLSRYAISLIGMAKGERATETFVAVLQSLPPETRAIMLRALGNRGDGSASKAIIAATKDEDVIVRVAALEALGKVGDASAAPVLVEAAAAADGGERNVARASLKLLGGIDVDRGLLQLLAGDDAKVRVEAIHALADREASAAVSQLLKATEDEDASVRREAIRALGVLARESDFVAMVKVALAAKEQDDRSAVVDAMGKAFLRVEDKQQCAAPVLAELGQAPADAKPTLVRLLGKTGSAQALRTVRAALADTDAAMKDAAVHALAGWPDNSASDDLLKLISDAKDTAHKETALKGYLRLAAASENPAEMYLRALKRVETVGDKKGVLEGLGLTSEAPEALDLTVDLLDDKALQAAAGIAALRIADRLRQRDEQRARATLKQVLAKVDHPDVQKRAQEVMNELDKYQDHILQWVGVGPFTEKGKDGAAIYAMVFEPEKPDAQGIEWKPITKGIGSWEINLEATYGSLDFCGAYLRTRVWSETEQDAQLEMGSDDGVKAWLNSKLVFDRWNEGSAAPRQKLVKVKLAKGWNELMLKIVDQQGGWVGAARIRKPDGTALEGLKIQAE